MSRWLYLPKNDSKRALVYLCWNNRRHRLRLCQLSFDTFHDYYAKWPGDGLSSALEGLDHCPDRGLSSTLKRGFSSVPERGLSSALEGGLISTLERNRARPHHTWNAILSSGRFRLQITFIHKAFCHSDDRINVQRLCICSLSPSFRFKFPMFRAVKQLPGDSRCKWDKPTRDVCSTTMMKMGFVD